MSVSEFTLEQPVIAALLPPFLLGDANGDATLDISDAITTLGHLFLGAPQGLACVKAADFNGDDAIDIGDPIASLQYIFGGVGGPPGPLRCAAPEGETQLTCEKAPDCGA